MSTLKVNSIKNTSTDDGGIAIDNSGHVQVDGVQMPSAGALSNRNVIINGNFVFAQRATSQTNTGVNSLDRWRAQESGATTTMSQESFTLGQTDVPGSSKFLKFDVTTGNNNAGVQQRVEAQNVYHFLGNKVTLSYFAKGTSPASGLEVAITWLDGSSASSSASTSVTLTSTWTKYTHTFTVPSDSGLTLTNAAASLEVKWMQFNSDTGTAAWELNLAQVQLELGDKATLFEHRSYGDELARCQRYYETTYRSGYSEGHNFNQQYPFADSRPAAINFIASDDTTSAVSFGYRVTKRTDPTVRLFSANTGASNKAHTYRNGAGNNSDVTVAAVMTTPNYCTIATSLNAVNRANEAYLHIVAESEL
jgi:hypothetical protein